MQNIRKKYFLPLFLSILMLLVVFVPSTDKIAYAGTNGKQLIDEALFEKESLDYQNWLDTGEGGYKIITQGEQNILRFGGPMTDADRSYRLGNPLVSIKNSADMNSDGAYIKAKLSISLYNISEGKRFGFVFAQARRTGNYDSEGACFLYFTYENGYKFGMTRRIDGMDKNVFAPESLPVEAVTGDNAEPIELRLDVSADGSFTIYMFKSVVKTGIIPDIEIGDLSGYVALTQSGIESSNEVYLHVELTDFSVSNEYYDRPLTPVIIAEDFWQNDYDTNMFNYSGKGLYIRDQKLRYDKGMEGAHFSTKYAYSNFGLYFSLSDIKNLVEEDDTAPNGIKAVSSRITMSFGADFGQDDLPASAYGIEQALLGGNFFYFDTDIDINTGKRSSKTYVTFYASSRTALCSEFLPEKYDFLNWNWDDPDTEIFIKITVIDGQFDIFMRTPDEIGYTNVFSLTLKDGHTKKGNIFFWGDSWTNVFAGGVTPYPNRYSDYSIDNISIVNLDERPNTFVPTNRVSNKIAPTEDYEFIDEWTNSDLLGAKLERGLYKGFPTWGIVLIIAGGVLLLGGAATTIVLLVKKNKKGETLHEKEN